MAYACGPGRGSEPGIGWNRVVELARHCDLWVLCEQHEFEPAIRRYLAEHGPVPGLNFFFVPMHSWERAIQRIPGLYFPFYQRWQRRALRVAQRVHAEVRFDLVHHLTLGGYREPGYLWQLDAPFLWGPTGGTENYPWRFLGEAGLARGIQEVSRSVVNWLQLRFSPRVARALKKASLLLTSNSLNRENFLRVHGRESVVFPDLGLKRISGGPRGPRPAGQPLRLLCTGRLEPRKALSLLIRALARLPAGTDCEIRIAGEGPAEGRWRRLARRLGVDHRITWMGWLSYDRAMEQYAWADALAFCSLRDTTGTAVLEALGASLPVLCLDHQGVGEVVTDRCGIKIPVTTPSEVIDRLAAAIETMSGDPDLCARLSRGAHQRAEEFLWESQARRLFALYRRVTDEHALNGSARTAADAANAFTAEAAALVCPEA
jgi:glycosyltransferase involved in cell wall biosynthesis